LKIGACAPVGNAAWALNIGIETLSSTAEVRLKKSFFIGVMLRSTGLGNLTLIDSSLDVAGKFRLG
jgi:hypothetical protein